MVLIRRGLAFIPRYFKFGNEKISTEAVAADGLALKRLHRQVTEWCIRNAVLVPNPATGIGYIPNIAAVGLDNKLRLYLYSVNLKRLSVDANLGEFLLIMKDTEFDKTTTRLIDLYVQVVAEFDPRFINLYINKLIHALETIYPNDDEADYAWTQIFTDYPYLWLLFIVQQIMRQNTPIGPLG